MAKRSLQGQGVPIPDRLGRSERGNHFAQQRPTPTPARQTTYQAPIAQRSSRSKRNPSDYNPAALGSQATDKATGSGGVGGLEGEFLIAIALLIGLMFANSSASYGDRIMSLMKRGALTCLLFFILAIIAGIGPGATKVAKGIGALVIVGILVTSPTNTLLTDVDNIIKNDWVGTSESSGASSDTGTQQSTNGGNSPGLTAPTSASGLLNDLENIAKEADGQSFLQQLSSNLGKLGIHL